MAPDPSFYGTDCRCACIYRERENLMLTSIGLVALFRSVPLNYMAEHAIYPQGSASLFRRHFSGRSVLSFL